MANRGIFPPSRFFGMQHCGDKPSSESENEWSSDESEENEEFHGAYNDDYWNPGFTRWALVFWVGETGPAEDLTGVSTSVE